MPGEINCIVTKVLIPFLEREVGLGAEGSAAICRVAGRSRDWLMADHNWIPLSLANELMRLGQELMGEPDEERWVRRYWDYGMDWKPREERSYLGDRIAATGPQPAPSQDRFDVPPRDRDLGRAWWND